MLSAIITTGQLLFASWSVLNGTAIAPVSATVGQPVLQVSSLTVQTDPDTPGAYPVEKADPTIFDIGGSADLSDEEQALFDETNADRERVGLPDLTLDPLLCMVARGHSEDMDQRQYFGHIAPQPGPASPTDRYLAALGYRPDHALIGENIYYRSATDLTDSSAVEADSAFMRSPGHRANILRAQFTEMGVGFYRDPATGAFWVTEMFLSESN